MPRVVYFCLWGEGPFEYSSVYFLTVRDSDEPLPPQINIPSGGQHVAIVRTEDLADRLRESILEVSRLLEEGDEECDEEGDHPFDTVTIHEHMADENDHYFCFSGPPDSDALAMYKIDIETNTFASVCEVDIETNTLVPCDNDVYNLMI